MTTAIEVGLGLGSNLGDRLLNLQRGRDAIAALPGVRLVGQSRVYETEPVDVRPEHADRPYLNAVLIVEAARELRALAADLHRLEAEAGRVRGEDRNAPRPLDIDILFAGGLRLRAPDLQVPHLRWAQRRFVVQPLADVRPDALLPDEPRPVHQVLADLPLRPAVALFQAIW